jgi:phosphopantothenoylcysteine decarboxylase/phosphopantothenate--cysteine ligase
MDVACLSAAVCDFKPQSCSQEKFKKDSLCDGRLEIAFAKNPDILLELGRSKGPQQQLIGFAAETDAHIAEAAEAKLRKKNLDLIVANRIGEAEAGFDSSTNAVLLLDRHNRHQEYAIQSKADIAWRIWDWILLS